MLPSALAALSLTLGSANAQECQSGFQIKKLGFNMEAGQAYADLVHGDEEPIRVWAHNDEENGRFDAFYFETENLSFQDGLSILLQELSNNGSMLQGVADVAPGMDRARMHSVNVTSLPPYNGEGISEMFNMNIRLSRHSTSKEAIRFEGMETITPEDFALDGYDVEAFYIFLDDAMGLFKNAGGLGLRSVSYCP